MVGGLSVEEAIQRITSAARPLARESVPLAQCLGRVLAESVISEQAHPPFDNSAMDGFALRSADSGAGRVLTVVEEIAAGHPPQKALAQGEAARIMTGAVVPQGADAVIMVELTEDRGDQVELHQAVGEGANIRRAGEHLGAGETILKPGLRLSDRHIAMAAFLGRDQLQCARRPRVALLATGSELVEPGRPLGPGQIYNSNGYGLEAALRQFGAEVQNLGVAPDDPVEIRRRLEEGLASCDLLVTSAGVSVGKHDYVWRVMEELGGRLDFWKLRMRPGKPLGFGQIGEVPFLGLPGNPVSSMVGAHVYVQAMLNRFQGASIEPHRVRVTLVEEVRKREGFAFFMRARYEGPNQVRLTGPQGSHMFRSMVLADGLLEVPEEGTVFPRGTELPFRPFRTA